MYFPIPFCKIWSLILFRLGPHQIVPSQALLSQSDTGVVYLLCMNRYVDVHVSLVRSKNRLCPLMCTTTIPRFELQDTVLCTTLDQTNCFLERP